MWSSTSHFALLTAVFALHITHFTLHTSHCTLKTPHFTLHTPHVTLHTSHVTLHSSHSKLHTSQSTLHTSHFTVHTSHFSLLTAFFTLQTSHFTLHTALFMSHTSHCTLHTPHFISSEPFSPYPSSSLLISSLLICHLSFHESLPSTTTTELACAVRQPGPCVRALCEAVAVLLSKNTTCARPRYNANTFLTLHIALFTPHTAMFWGGSRSTKPCVFPCKVAAGDDERYLVCATGAVAVVPDAIGSFYVFCNKCLFLWCIVLCVSWSCGCRSHWNGCTKQPWRSHSNAIYSDWAAKHNRTTRNGIGNCSSKTGSRRQSEKKTILKHFLKGFWKGKSLAPKCRKSANKSISQPSCSHSNTIYEIQLQKTIVLRMQPQHEATLTQPFQCDLQWLSCKTQ